MKKSVSFFTVVVSILLLGSFSVIHFKTEKKPIGISAETASKTGIINLKIKGKGGYQEECIEAELKNNLSTDTLIRFEAGRRLIAEDSAMQDILIIRELIVHLAAKELKKIDLFGFCCRADRHGPSKNSVFDVGHMTDSSWIKLCRLLSETVYPKNVMQSAVWVLSNDHAINSIHNDNEADFEKMQKLYKYLSGVKGIKYVYPWYTVIYKPDTSRVFSNRPEKMFGKISYNLPHHANVDMIVRNIDNLTVATIFSNQAQSPNTYDFRFTLNISILPKGKYNLLVLADNHLILKKEFEF
jgi:hypothetical protein